MNSSLSVVDCIANEWMHKLHRYADLLFHAVGALLNTILIVLINRHSGDSAGPYKNVFRLTCACDFAISIFSVFGQKVVIPYEGDMLFFSNSLFSLSWPVLDLISVSAITGVHLANSIFLPSQYIYRYLSLCSSAETRKYAMTAVISITCFVAVAGLVVAFKGMTPPPGFQERAVRRLVQSGWGCYDESEIPYMFGSEFFELEFMIYWLMVMVVVFVGYAIIVVSEIMLMRKLNALGSTTNAATRKMQAEFKLALTALAVCPLIFLVLPCSYFIFGGMFSLRLPAGLSSFFTMMTSSIAVANPVATIATVRPYRNKVKEWVYRITRRRVFAEAGPVVSGATKSGLLTTTTGASAA
ncbi:SRJ-21 protein [Aphelenchoides avenae]|nr:SRJ-21 protein [Aphelenchus avenae]